MTFVRWRLYDELSTTTVFLYDGVCTMALERWLEFDGVSLMACVQLHTSDGVRPITCLQWRWFNGVRPMVFVKWVLTNGVPPMIVSNDVCPMALVRRVKYDDCFSV